MQCYLHINFFFKSNTHQKEIWKTSKGMPIIPELESKTQKLDDSLTAEQTPVSKQQNSKPEKMRTGQQWSTSLACPKPQGLFPSNPPWPPQHNYGPMSFLVGGGDTSRNKPADSRTETTLTLAERVQRTTASSPSMSSSDASSRTSPYTSSSPSYRDNHSLNTDVELVQCHRACLSVTLSELCG